MESKQLPKPIKRKLSRQQFIKIRVTEEEKKAITANANAVSLHPSTFLRNLGIGYEPTSTLDQQAILELLQVNNHLSRLGSLLKMWLSNDERFNTLSVFDIERFWEELQATKQTLQEKVRAL